jgi:uncharacterized protein (TIGR00251 family)
VLELHVQPGARRTEVAGLHGARLKIRLAARAVEGAANEALVAFLAKSFNVARREVTIEAGARSRAKRVCVRGARGVQLNRTSRQGRLGKCDCHKIRASLEKRRLNTYFDGGRKMTSRRFLRGPATRWKMPINLSRT